MPASPFEPVELTGDRIRLVPLDADHAAGIADAWAPGTMDLFGTSDAPDPADPDSAARWIDSVLDERDRGLRVPFVVLDRESDRVLGTSSYLRIDPAIPRLEIGGTWYAPDVRGSHVNPEAKLLLLGHAFEHLDVHCVLLMTSAWNTRSQRAIQRLGAVRDGVLRAERRQRDGRIRDTVCYSIVADDWPRVRAGLERRLGRRPPPEPVDVEIRRATPHDAAALTAYLARNVEHLAPFVPVRPAGHDDPDSVRSRLASPDRIQYLALLDDHVVGQCAISNVIPAPVFRSCTIGYDVDADLQGRGIATTLVEHVTEEALTTHGLHRVEAGTLVHNRASQRVLEHCGFTRIGVAPRHVQIAGEWQDHVLYVRTAEDRMA